MKPHAMMVLLLGVLLMAPAACGPEPEWARDPLLKRVLQQSYSGPRMRALGEFGRLDEPTRRAYVPMIVAALRDDPNEYVRMNAAYTLGTMGELAADAEPALATAAAHDRSELVRWMARESLAVLGHDTDGMLAAMIAEYRSLARARSLEDRNRRHAVLGSIVRIAQAGHTSPAAVELLAQLLESDDDRAATLAAQGLFAVARHDPAAAATAEPALRRAVTHDRMGHIAALALDTLAAAGR